MDFPFCKPATPGKPFGTCSLPRGTRCVLFDLDDLAAEETIVTA